MARTVDHQKRRDLANRAFAVIRKCGVHRVSMSDLAAALNMKRPTFYWYFKDLSEIFDAVLEQRNEQLRDFVIARLAGIEDALDLLYELMRATADFYADRLDDMVIMHQLWAASGTDTSGVRRRMHALVEPARAELVARLECDIRTGTVLPCDPHALVDLVLAVIDGTQMQRATRDSDPAPVVSAMRRHVLEPLRALPGRRKGVDYESRRASSP